MLTSCTLWNLGLCIEMISILIEESSAEPVIWLQCYMLLMTVCTVQRPGLVVLWELTFTDCTRPTKTFSSAETTRMVRRWQFYESALTDHKNAFLFITKTHEKVPKTHRFKNRRCGSLAVIVTTTVHDGSSCHKHQTWAPQLWDSNWYHQWFTESQAGT